MLLTVFWKVWFYGQMKAIKKAIIFSLIKFLKQARNSDQKRKWTLELKGLIVDSLAASVPEEVCSRTS